MPDLDRPTPTTPKRQARSQVVRLALLDAAVHEFAACGFEAASTRAIAARAGTHQPQINYHFASKADLWRAAVDHLFAQLNDVLVDALVPDESGPAIATREGFAGAIRAFVRASAKLPELNRIMVQEAVAGSDRLAWIVDRHIRPGFEVVIGAWNELLTRDEVPPIDAGVLYYSVIGGASLAYVNAAEARLLGIDPLDDRFVEAHADALVAMVLGPNT
ncbi:MAG: TetR/AcrR family transcriptional regulator [Actinomycetota bacterium]